MAKTTSGARNASRANRAGLPRRDQPPRNTVSLQKALSELSNRPDLLDVEEVDTAAIEIGLELKRARERRGLTQMELAKATGFGQGAISDIERGKGRDGPSYRIIRDISAALDAEVIIEPRIDSNIDPAKQREWLMFTEMSKNLALIHEISNVTDCMPFIRSLLKEDVYSKLVETTRKIAAHRSGYKVTKSALCRFWSLPPHEHAQVSPKTTMVIVTYNGDGVLRRAKSRQRQADNRIIIAKDGDTIEVLNSGDSDLSVLTMPVTKDFREKRREY